jgi:hypothetical protein
MMSHDLPNLNFPLTGNGPLSVAVRALGLENFADVADFIRLLPYGRVADGATRQPSFEHTQALVVPSTDS